METVGRHTVSQHLRTSSGKKRLAVAAAFLACLVLLCSTSSAITLVKDGQPQAVIIVSDQSPSAADVKIATDAANLLQDNIKRISGATLPIKQESQMPEPATDQQPWVVIGEGRLTGQMGLNSNALGDGGIFQRAKGNVLVLFGKNTPSSPFADSNGTRFATTIFLEKLGVRQLWPGELGRVVPSAKTIDIQDFERSYSPKLQQRFIRQMQYGDQLQAGLTRLGFTRQDYESNVGNALKMDPNSVDWAAWNCLGGNMHINGGHAFGEYWKLYGKDHPDWFALQPDGTRDQSKVGDRVRLCESNKDLIAQIAVNKIKELDDNPTVLGVSIGPCDGGKTTFCTCPQCEALDAPNGRMIKLAYLDGEKPVKFDHVSLTDRFVYFWNAIAEQVAKARPDRYLVIDAYSAYSSPPVMRKLDDNLVLRCSLLSYGSDKDRQQDQEDFKGWAKAVKRFYWRPNLLLAGRRDGLPMIFVHKFGEDFKTVAGYGVMGTDFDSIVGNWATQGLNYYVAARLMWDPDQDVDAIVDDYCQSGFGPGAKSVRHYFDTLEKVLDQDAQMPNVSYTPVTPGFTPEVLATLQKDMADARQAVGNDGPYSDRLTFLEWGMKWTVVEARVHNLGSDASKIDMAVAKPLLDARTAMMHEIFQKEPLAVNVGYVTWGEGTAVPFALGLPAK